jgi:hypothetical protein
VLLLVAYVAHLTVGLGGARLDGFFDDWVQCGLLLHGCAVCVIGGRRQERTGPWMILAAGLGSWAVANVVWSAWVGRMPEPPYPSASDALWLAYYPAAYVSLVLLVRDRVERFRASVWLDGLIGALPQQVRKFDALATMTGRPVRLLRLRWAPRRTAEEASPALGHAPREAAATPAPRKANRKGRVFDTEAILAAAQEPITEKDLAETTGYLEQYEAGTFRGLLKLYVRQGLMTRPTEDTVQAVST